MKKFISFLLCILIFIVSLCACGGSGKDSNITTQPQKTQPQQTQPEITTPPATTQPDSENTKLFIYEEISLTVPKKFEDITQELGGGMYHFVVGDKLLGVFASRMTYPGASYMKYGQMIAQSLNISDEVIDCGGYARLSYDIPEIETSEDIAVFPAGEHFWVITIKCHILNFEGFRIDRDRIFQSVRIDTAQIYSGVMDRNKEKMVWEYENIRLRVPAAFYDLSQIYHIGDKDFVLADQDYILEAQKIEGFTPQSFFDTYAANYEITKSLEEMEKYCYFQYVDVLCIYDVYMFTDRDGLWVLTMCTYYNAYDIFTPITKEIVDSVEILQSNN